MQKKGGATPVWLVTRMNEAPYDDQLPHCCGVFTNMEDAELRRELLQIPQSSSNDNQYYVVCVCVDPADAKYAIELDVDSPPGIVS